MQKAIYIPSTFLFGYLVLVTDLMSAYFISIC